MRGTENGASADKWDFSFEEGIGFPNGVQEAQIFYSYHDKDFPFLFDINELADFLNYNPRYMLYTVGGINKHYQNKRIQKKKGGTRHLHVPDWALKYRQNVILRNIVLRLPVSKYAMAYVPGRNLIENAVPHVGKRYLLKMDISNFFGSIRFQQVYAAAFHKKHFPKQVGWILTAFCCYKGVLPQGAATSPAISNLVMRNFDDTIGGWCERHRIAYTRYSDDMTFSSDKPLYHVYQKVKSILEESGFQLNERKTRFVTNASWQSVTGLTVNEKVTVSREYKRRVRQEVYYALKYRELSETDKLCLIGKISYILQIEPNNTQFQTALEQMRKL